jgi:hypothetical protein
LLQISAFSLESHAGPYETWPRRTRLYFNGEFTGVSIPGFIIEAQYQLARGFLLITSQDCPFEESNDFLLLDSQFKQLAHNELLVPYGSFLLHAHWPESQNSWLLHYHESLIFRLSIQEWPLHLGLRLILEEVPDADLDDRARQSITDARLRLRAG